MNPASPRNFDLKALVALTVAVLSAHLAMLMGTSMQMSARPTASFSAFITRSIAMAPTALPPHEQPPLKRPVPQQKIRSLTPIEKAVTGETGSATPIAVQLTGSADEPSSAAPPPAPEQALAATINTTLPGSASLKYQVQSNKFPFRLNAELRWKNTGENYEARMELSAFGLSRVQSSHGLITPQGLAPIRFSDKYRSEVAAHFNREQGKVTFSANTPDVALQSGAQDRLSILLQLAGMIANAPSRYPASTVITTQTIGPRAADTWVFTIISEETLTLPGGELTTLKLVRNPRQEYDQKAELWLAPAMGYLPVRIRITESNGDFVDQKWLSTEAVM